MQYGLAGKPENPIDEGYPITFGETGETYTFMHRWDSATRWQELGGFCLKIFDDTNGLVEAWVDEETFEQVLDYTGAEPHDRTFMTPAEKEAFRKSQGGEESL